MPNIQSQTFQIIYIPIFPTIVLKTILKILFTTVLAGRLHGTEVRYTTLKTYKEKFYSFKEEYLRSVLIAGPMNNPLETMQLLKFSDDYLKHTDYHGHGRQVTLIMT